MPNGISGGFRLTKRELGERLASLVASQEVGYTIKLQPPTAGERDVPVANPADAARVLEMLKEFKGSDVFIEEQDRRYYIIHLDSGDHSDGSKWVSVNDTSPLFSFLRERHQSTGASW